jgi:hypothetical protein
MSEHSDTQHNRVINTYVSSVELRFYGNLYEYINLKVEELFYRLRRANCPDTREDIVIVVSPNAFMLLIARCIKDMVASVASDLLTYTFCGIKVFVDIKAKEDGLVITNNPVFLSNLSKKEGV